MVDRPAFAWANDRAAQSFPSMLTNMDGASTIVPSLQDLALDTMAKYPDMIVDITCTAEHLALGLLWRLMNSGRLDFRLACVFRDSGHECLRQALEGLNLLDAMPTHNATAGSKYCR